MGLSKGSDGVRYLKVRAGKFLLVNPKGDLSLPDKEGNLVVYDSFKEFTGGLVGIDKREGKFGFAWEFKLADRESGEEYTISMPYGSINGQGFVNTLANCKQYADLRFNTWEPKVKKNEFDATRIYITEPGEKDSVKWKFTLDELPPVTNRKDEDGEDILDKNGKPLKNDKKRLAFFDLQVIKINEATGYISSDPDEFVAGLGSAKPAATSKAPTSKAAAAKEEATQEVGF